VSLDLRLKTEACACISIKHALELYSDVETAREQMTDVADRATN